MNFIAPAFLYGLSAIALPIILHLIELRRAKRIVFTNVSFIKEVKNINSRHRRLKHILILLARICFLIFLVLMFAQPFIPAAQSFIPDRNIKIYLDNSLSLQNESDQEGRSLLDQAIQHSQQLVSNVSASVTVNIFNNFRTSNSFTNFTANKAKNYLADTKYSASAKNLPAVLSGFFTGADKPFDGFIYSDFQRNTFLDRNLQEIKDLKSNFYLVHLQGNANYNAFVDSVYLEDEFIRLNANNKIKVNVRNSGNQNIENCLVKFFIGNQQFSTLSLSIPAKQSKSFDLVYRLTDTAPKQCRIVLQDFPVDFDNTYYFTLQASNKISIVDINNNTTTATNRLYTNEPSFQYSSIRLQQFNYTLLKNADLIILNGLTQLTSAFADNLQDYLKAGGSVAFIPAAKGNATVYQNFFQKLGISPVRYQALEPTAASQMELANVDVNNPFFRNIFEATAARMKMPTAAPVLFWSRSSEDLLKYRNGNKFLSVFQKGRGRVYLFASPFQETYSDFASHALFVPVMYKLAMQSFKHKQQLSYSLAQHTVQFPVTSNNNKEVFKLIKDSISFIPEQQVYNGMANLTIPDELNEAGFYKLQSGDKVLTTIALNYNKKESDLNFYSVGELKNLMRGAKNVKVLEASDEIALKNLFAQDNLGTQLWKYCLILCLFFALTEILLIRFL